MRAYACYQCAKVVWLDLDAAVTAALCTRGQDYATLVPRPCAVAYGV
jgi:hypothetical protein